MLLLFALVVWLVWYVHIAQITERASSYADRLVLYQTPVGCLFVLAVCLTGMDGGKLRIWSDSEWNWFGAGALVLALAALAFPWWGWGLSPLDDVAERRNRFASWAIGGAMLGLTLEFAGVVEAARQEVDFTFLVLPYLFVLWGILEKLAGLSEAITVERDGGAALRLTTFLAALGLMLKQALPALRKEVQQAMAVGESAMQLFRLGGPFALLLAAILIERWRRHFRSTGCGPKRGDFIIGLIYLVGAGLWTYFSR